jgi:hypothetical protein
VTNYAAAGDPTEASREHGERYWEKALAIALDAVQSP